MDEWGQGPWFDPQGPKQEGEPAGQQPADTSMGEPADTADTDFLADEPLTAQEAGPGASGSFRQPPIPSRPLGPDRSYISGGPALWYDSASQPISQPLSQPIPQMPVYGGYSPPPSGVSPRAAGKGNGRRRGRAWLLVLALALLVLAVSSAAGILTGYLPQLTGFGGPSGGPDLSGILTQPTPTATSTPLPTPTPLVPTAATITLTAASTQRSSSGTMTSCPHGCNITGNTYGSSKGFSGSYPATFVSQQHLIGAGAIHVTTNLLWSQSGVVFSGGGYSCQPVDVTVNAGGSADYDCTVNATSPSTLSAGTIHGTADNGHATFTQPIALNGDAHYTANSADCSAAFSDLHNQGKSWATSWNSGLSIPSGWRVARSSPRVTYSGDSCPQGQTTSANFTASSTTNASNAAYNLGAAQTLASSRLDSTLPKGYAWLYSTRTTCSPSFKSVDSSNKVTLGCSDSGAAYYVWTSTAKSSLAGKIAGHSKTQALATCNKTAGVKSNSCSISIIGGDGAQLPQSAGVLTVVAKTP